MKKANKVLSLVIALIMLCSLFVLPAQALTYTPSMNTGDLGIVIKADKTEVKPGDTITYSVYIKTGGSYTGDFGPWMMTLVYNNKQVNPISTTNTEFRAYVNGCANFMKQTSVVNFNFPITNLTPFMTEDEKAYYTKAIMMNGVVDTGLGVINKPGQGWTPEDENTPMCTFKMVVSDDVQPGEEIWVGNHEASYLKKVDYMSPAGGTRYPDTAYDLSQSMAKVTVASDEPAGPAVAKAKSQVKMTPTSATTVADEFQFRVTSVITDADWDTYFANTGTAEATTNAITALGFVAYKGTKGFDLETAKAVAKGDQLPNESYYAATTDYVQKADDSSDAYFGAVVDITSAETRSDATYIAFVEYLDADGATQYAFYDAAGTALLNTNYDTIVRDYLKAFPFAG